MMSQYINWDGDLEEKQEVEETGIMVKELRNQLIT